MNTEIRNVWMQFQRDITEATNTLICTLQGINLVYRREEGLPVNSFPVPDYPPLKVFPQVSKNTPFSDRVAPGGPVEQFAFKAWVVEVYSIWESIYRGELQRVFKTATADAIRPETDVLGDLGYIRTDLIHRKGIGGECARCKVLQWFTRGEKIRMTIRHVLDFHNQMGWISDNPIHVNDDRVILWLPFREQWTPAETTPRLISVRPIIDEDLPSRYGASIVFEDGIFAKVPMVAQTAVKPLTDKQWMTISIDGSGNLSIPPGHTVASEILYPLCFGPVTRGPGTFSPAFKIG